jgi:hypothetical protein
MKTYRFYLAVTSLLLLASCTAPAQSSAKNSFSSDSSSLKASDNSQAVSSSQDVGNSASSSSNGSSIPVSESSASSSSATASSNSSEIKTLTMLPGEFPTSSNQYPEPGETTFSGEVFYLEDVEKSSANPTQSDGTVLKTTNVDIIQMKATSGLIANSNASAFQKIVITVLDNTNAYNLAYAQPSLFYGSIPSPTTDSVKGTFVPGQTAEGYKTFVGTYVLDKAYPFISIANDGSSVEGQARALKAFSIVFNPA